MPGRGGSLCILIAGLGACSFAADVPSARQFQGQRIVSIRFEPERQPLAPDELARILPLKAGATFSADQLRSAIKRLYATGRYTNIAAEGEPAGNGLAVVIRTSERWFVGRVNADDHVRQPPTPGQMTGSSRLELGQPLLDGDIEQATDRVLELLRQNGYYEAKVKPEITRDPLHQQVNVTFLIEAGPRAHFRHPVVTGSPVLDPLQVSRATKWKRFWPFGWKTTTQENVQTGLQNLRKRYQEKDRLMANIAVDDIRYDPKTKHAIPTLKINAGPKVELHTAGAKVPKRKLKQYVPIFDEMTVDRDLLTEGARNLRDYFQIQGYFDVEVDYQLKRAAQDHQDIVYVINLGRRQKLVEVGVQGNRYFPTSVIEERMMLRPAGWLILRHGRYSQGAVSRDESTIKLLYEANGFRDVKVTVQTIDDYQGKQDEIAAVLHVDEGAQYKVAKLTVNGIRQLDANQIRRQLSTIEGQPFSEYNVSLDRNYIVQRYNEEGFAEAAFHYTARPGPQPNTFEVSYEITEGARHFVREVLIAGNRVTSPRLYRPAIHIQKGEPLSLKAMSDTQENLADLGIFDSVNMGIQNPDGDTRDKYVVYELLEGHRYRLAGGVGAEIARVGGGQTSYTNPGGATGFVPRANLDVSRENMWGLGHTLNFKGRLSTIDQLGSINYYAPRYRNVEGRNITITGLWEKSLNVRTFSSRRLEGSAQLSQQLTKASTMLYRFSYRRTTVDMSTLKIEPLLIPLFAQPARVGMLSGNYIFDRRDDPTDAHKGIYTTLDLGLSNKAFGSNRNFARFLGTTAIYRSLGRNFVFAERFQFGWLGPFALPRGLNASTAIPLPERFFGGGSTSMRGFPDNQAGPRDALTGFPLGGNALLFNNAEVRFPFLGDNIGGVLFWDAGNVFETPGKISFRFHQRDLNDFNYTVHAVGFGIRYRTPVGPVRVDLAYSVNPPSFMGLKGTPQEVLFGTAPRVRQNISHFQFFFSIGQAF